MMELPLFQWLLLLRSPTVHEAIIASLLLFPLLLSLLYRLHAKIRRRNKRLVGLHILSHESSDDGVKYEIVAVHGLGADPEHTWTCKPNSRSKSDSNRGRVHLLKDLLMKDERFSDARIIQFAYNSDWLVDACFESAHDIGLRLIESLTEHRKSHARLPIIFVGHSFGGIVIKEALASSREDSYETLEDTCGIIFLGTPHLGSPVAGLGASIAYLTGFLGSDTGLLLLLRSNGEMLVNLSKRFQASVGKKRQELSKETKIVSICERKPTYLLNCLYAGKIVPWESATFGANFIDVYEVDKDHSGLNKCLNPEDPLYKELTAQIYDMRPTAPPKINKLQQAVIDRLAPVTAYDAEFHPGLDEYGRGHLECLPETREEVLEDIYDWLDECGGSSHKHLYWLQGKAGTGKSTIARTVVSRMVKENRMAANFFFKRGEGDRARLKRFFTTLATQLVRKLPSLAKSIQDALESEPSLPEQDPRVQFKMLIQEPMEEQKFEDPKAMVIVIDALDECDSEGDLTTLVQLLLQPIFPRDGTQSSSPKFRVKYFVTSRLDHNTQSDFNKIPNEKGEKKGLEEATSETAERDIEKYLQFQLERIDGLLNPHPGESLWSNPIDVQNREKLATLAGPLFEFAATACRYISNKRIPGGPRNHLHDILESKVRGDLKGVYLPILKQRFRDLEDQDFDLAKEQFETIIGSFLGLADSITVACFVRILGLQEIDVRDELQHFESVLIVPPGQDNQSCVKLFHESFRDFLIGPTAYQDFKIDTNGVHKHLATRCRRLLCGALHENIGKLERPGTYRSEVSRTSIEEFLPPDVQYACRFWSFHVKKSEATIEDDDDWHSFLLSHFLHWLEALTFLDRVSESGFLIKELQAIIHPTNGSKVMSFLRDAERFILSFRPIIDVAPLQLYSSALSFAPTNSLVRKTFEACRSSWITRAPNVALQWSPNLQTLEGHGAWIQCVAFSSEGLLASGDQHGIVKIWDPISGTCLHNLRIGEEQIAVALAFSETGKLACMTESSISIWDANQCTYSHSLDYLPCLGYSGLNNPMAFLNDQRLLLVNRMKNKVLIWKPGHNIEGYDFGQHSYDSTPVLSFDGRWVAWVGKEEIKILKTFKSDCSPHVLAAAGEIGTHEWTTCFSRDSQYFAFGNYIGTVMVWSITSSERIKVFRNNEDILTMAFSPDNQILAIGSFGARIAIWDWKKDICLQTLTGHHFCITSLSYSLDGAWLASGSGDYRVTIWDATAPISITADTRSDHYINSITMTKGDQKLVTKRVTGKYKLWDAFGGEWISPPDDDGTASLVAVSANGNMLVTVSDSELRAWDLGTGDCLLKSERPHLEIIHSIALSASGERLVLGIDSGEVELLESGTGQRFKKVHVRETRTIVRVAISPDGRQVASAVEGSVWVENILTGRFLALEFNESQTDGVENIGFSENGERLAAVTYLWAGIIWDLATGTCLRKFSRGREGLLNVYVWRLDLSFINFDFAVVTGSPEEQLREDCLIKYHINFDGAWLMRHNEKLLWLPPDYRPSAAAASGSTIAIGCRLNSGYPIVVEISEDGP